MGGPVRLAIADTSLFVALEQARPLRATPPERVAVSVITIAELRASVLAATDTDTTACRLATLERPASRSSRCRSTSTSPRPGRSCAVELLDLGRRMPVNDSWIAATVIGAPVPCRDPGRRLRRRPRSHRREAVNRANTPRR